SSDDSRWMVLTEEGTSVGTPAYMAPEQVAGDAVDGRADLYALGILGYEMLAGLPPFHGRTGQRVLSAHLTETPQRIELRRPSVPVALARLVKQLLEKQPADRPQTADDVLEALDAMIITRDDSRRGHLGKGA